MTIAKSASDASRTRHRYVGHNGHAAWVTSYFGTEPLTDRSIPAPPLDTLFPVGFMVEEEPGATLDPHFHQANQFQLFVAGDGSLGSDTIAPVTVHYANAYTPYGPIKAGPRGLRYLTLRNGWDSGPRYIARHRDELRLSNRPRRQISATVFPAAATSLAPLATEIFSPHADGLAGWLHRLPRGTAMSGPRPRDGGGQFWVVLRGKLTASSWELDGMSCLFLGPDEAPLEVSASGDDAEFVVLQFPRGDTA